MEMMPVAITNAKYAGGKCFIEISPNWFADGEIVSRSIIDAAGSLAPAPGVGWRGLAPLPACVYSIVERSRRGPTSWAGDGGPDRGAPSQAAPPTLSIFEVVASPIRRIRTALCPPIIVRSREGLKICGDDPRN